MTRNTVDDGGLARLLAEAGSAMSVGEVDALIAGVVAAPVGVDGAAWMTLVTPNPGDTLRAALGARVDAARAALADDAADGPAPAGRLADLRAELARRELTGFVVPRADPAPQRGPAARRRAPGLADRLFGFGRRRRRARREGGDLHRRPLHLAGPLAGRRRGLRVPPSDRRAADRLGRRQSRGGRPARLRPVAAYARRAWRATARRARRPAPSWSTAT